MHYTSHTCRTHTCRTHTLVTPTLVELIEHTHLSNTQLSQTHTCQTHTCRTHTSRTHTLVRRRPEEKRGDHNSGPNLVLGRFEQKRRCCITLHHSAHGQTKNITMLIQVNARTLKIPLNTLIYDR